jgi:hypothetical protein
MLTSGMRLLITAAVVLTVAACGGATGAKPVVPTVPLAALTQNQVQSAPPVTPAGSGQNEVAPPQAVTPNGNVLGGGSKQIGELTVWLSDPAGTPVRGQNKLEALVVDAKGTPVTDARLSFDIDMTNMSHGKNVTPAPHVADGRYSANISFMMPGPWRLIVAVERGGQQIGNTRYDFNVNMR